MILFFGKLGGEKLCSGHKQYFRFKGKYMKTLRSRKRNSFSYLEFTAVSSGTQALFEVGKGCSFVSKPAQKEAKYQ